MAATAAHNISLPDTRREDRLDADLVVQLPFEELEFPDLPAEASHGREATDGSDSESEEDAPAPPAGQGFLGPRPAWKIGPADKITAYAAARHSHQSWALYGRADGTLDLHCSNSRFQKASTYPTSPPLSPEALSYPDSNLLTTRLIGRRTHRAVSAASSIKSAARSTRHKRSSSPNGSVRSSSSHTDLASGLGRHPRKASATLSISGLEAITSAPSTASTGPQATSLLQAPAIIEPSPTSPPDGHVLLSRHKLNKRYNVQDTWEEAVQDAEVCPKAPKSPTFDTPSTPETRRDFDWAEPLHHLARVYPPDLAPQEGFDEASQIRLVLSDSGFSQAVVVLTKSGRLYRVSLRDGRLRDLGWASGNLNSKETPMSIELVTLQKGTLILVFMASGLVRVMDVRTGKELQSAATGVSKPLIAVAELREDEPAPHHRILLLMSPSSSKTVSLTIAILPPSDVGPSIMTPEQVQMSLQALGDAPLVAPPTAICFAQDRLLVLCAHALHILEVESHRLVDVSASAIKAGAKSVFPIPSTNLFVVVYEDRFEAYRILLDETSVGELVPLWEISSGQQSLAPSIFSSYTVGWLSSSDLSDARLKACAISTDLEPDSLTLCKPLRQRHQQTKVTAAIALNNDSVALGYSDGRIAVAPLISLGQADSSSARPTVAQRSFSSPVSKIWLLSVQSQDLILATADSGQVGLWQRPALEMINLWSLFNAPVSQVAVASLQPEPTLLLVALDGTVALVPVHSSGSIKLMIPATREPLSSIHRRDDLMILRYRSGKARLYDLSSGELRQSLTNEAASTMIEETGWMSPEYESERSSPGRLRVRLREVVGPLASLDSWASGPHSEHEDTIGSHLGELGAPRLLLSHLFTSEISKTTLALAKSPFILRPCRSAWPRSFIMPADRGAHAHLYLPDAASAWSVSRHTTTFRLACLVTLVRLFLNYTETQRDADELIVYYSTFLAERLGAAFASPSLDLLADLWFDPSSYICDSIQLLFGSVVSTMPVAAQAAEVERWHLLLPISNEHELNQTQTKALLISGLVAVEAYKSLPAVTLRDISNLVANILNTEDSKARRDLQRISIELCSRGFEWIQRFVDAVELVKNLFALATGKDEGTPADLRSAASKAILQVAATNVQLFMATMAFDVLHTTSVNHRNATMRLVIFMVRRKPSVMHHSLPKLCEAIVHTLDPKDASLRTTMQQTSTIIIGELVRTYPSVAFDRNTQKLACGTSEGAVLIYDLKTATRLFVLESHASCADAVSFSPDGRRLVSLSLTESNVAVWKVGSSILGLLQPGKPPRQNSEGVGPYKRISFTLGDSSVMSLQSILEWARFDWQGDRTVSLRIRDASFTFAVA